MKKKSIIQNIPVWDEERNGVYIPLLDIVLQAGNLRDGIVKFHNWAKANELAEAAGGRLFTRDEAYILLYLKDAINAILREHGGDPLGEWTWTGSSSESSPAFAWGVHFSFGVVNQGVKSYSQVARAVVAF